MLHTSATTRNTLAREPRTRLRVFFKMAGRWQHRSAAHTTAEGKKNLFGKKKHKKKGKTEKTTRTKRSSTAAATAQLNKTQCMGRTKRPARPPRGLLRNGAATCCPPSNSGRARDRDARGGSQSPPNPNPNRSNNLLVLCWPKLTVSHTVVRLSIVEEPHHVPIAYCLALPTLLHFIAALTSSH